MEGQSWVNSITNLSLNEYSQTTENSAEALSWFYNDLNNNLRSLDLLPCLVTTVGT